MDELLSAGIIAYRSAGVRAFVEPDATVIAVPQVGGVG